MSQGHNAEVLYIEDDALTAQRVKRVIENAGFDCTHVVNGREALNLYRQHMYDLIAVDLNLPDMDGKEVIRKMREMRSLPPTIVITGFGDEQTVVEVMRLGVTDYISKDTDGRYIILIPAIFEMALYYGRMETLKRSIEKELHQSRENIRNLLNASKDFIFVINDEGKILNWNPSFQEAIGYTDEEIRRLTVFELYPPESKEEMLDTLRKMLEDEIDTYAVPMVRKNGQHFESEMRVSRGRWGDEQVLYIIQRDVTILRAAEREVRQSKRMLELVINNIPEHIFWKDTELRYLGCNNNFARAAGVEFPEDVIGRKDEDLTHVIQPDPDWIAQQQSVMENGHPQFHIVYQTANENGDRLFFDINRIPLKDEDDRVVGLLSTREDITQRVLMQEEIRERERMFSLITTNMQDLVGLVDRNFCWEYLSPSHQDVLGFAPEEYTGKKPLDFIHPDDIARVKATLMRGIKTRSAQKSEFRFRHSNGKYLWLETIGVPILDETGEISSVVLASRDVTARKYAEDALQQRTIELQESNEELDAFSHTVAHDLKNPLNSILGLANLVRENFDMPEEDIQDSLKYIEQSATNMNGIIDSLMVLAGVRKQEIVPEVIDMPEVLKQTMRRLNFYVEEHNADVTIASMPNALGHPIWIEEVWVNYITNAIKYGGKPPAVSISGERLSNGSVKYIVKDNGPGISPEDQRKLFVPFSRLRQVSVKGYGLGLSIVARIIHRLGGQVGLESAPGSGSSFYFILPAAPH